MQTLTPRSPRRHGLPIALVAVGCGLALAACGSSAKRGHTAGRNAFLAFSRCMRAQGVTNFPDPSPGGGIHLEPGMNPFAPSFKAARSACSKLLPGGGPGRGQPSPQAKAQTLRIAECMRRHGVSDFPDPTLSPPTSPAGYSEIVDRGGVVLAIPQTIETGSPAFKQAAAVCGFR